LRIQNGWNQESNKAAGMKFWKRHYPVLKSSCLLTTFLGEALATG
jgi:hypothetical protein